MTVALATGPAPVRAAIGVATAAGAAGVLWNHRAEPVMAALLAAVVLCYGALSAVDAAEQRLPNRITLPLAGATLAAVVVGAVTGGDVTAAVAAVGTGAAFAAVLVVLRFGMGDVKLALTVGMVAGWLGRAAVVATIMAGAAAGAAVALVLLAVHRRRGVAFSFGPALAIGSVVGMLAVRS
ncbi:MAG: prepilin peptidase [Acidimicrobiales bacterium]